MDAGDDIVQAGRDTLRTVLAGETITMTAGYLDSDSHGGITSAGTIQTNNGNMSFSALDSIILNIVNAGTADVVLNSVFGTVTVAAITANDVTATSEDGITLAGDMDTLVAQVTGAGK